MKNSTLVCTVPRIFIFITVCKNTGSNVVCMSVVYRLLLMDLKFHRGFGFWDILILEPSKNFVLEKLILLSRLFMS